MTDHSTDISKVLGQLANHVEITTTQGGKTMIHMVGAINGQERRNAAGDIIEVLQAAGYHLVEDDWSGQNDMRSYLATPSKRLRVEK